MGVRFRRCPLSLRSLRALPALALVLALGFGLRSEVRAQEASDDPAAAEAAQRDRSAAAQAELDAKVQSLRQQLTAATEPTQRYAVYGELIDTYYKAGRITDSLKVGDELVQDTTISPGRRSLRASQLGLSWALLGDFNRSRRYIAQAKTLAGQTSAAELEELPREPAYSYLHAEGEIARRAENRHDQALAKTRETSELAWRNFTDPSLSDKRHRAAANELLNNANFQVRLLVQNNRRSEALGYVGEIKQRIATYPELRATPHQIAEIGEAEAIALSSQDDYDGALAAIETSIASYKRQNLPEFDSGYNYALRMKLMIGLATGRIRDYAADADTMQRGRAANAVLAGSWPPEEADSLTLASRGQWADAAATINKIVLRNLKRQGVESPFTKYQTAMQLLYQMNDPARPVTQGDLEQFVGTLASDDADWADGSYRGAYVEDGALSTALGQLVPAGGAASESGAALAFRISELLRSNASQGALADGASRLAAGNPKLRGLIEQEQALRFDRNTSRASFARASDRVDRLTRNGNADEQVLKRTADDAAEKGKSYEASGEKLKQLRRQISAEFPVYRELVSPNIPGAAKVAAALRPGEVYVNFYSASNAGYAFVIQPGGKLTAVRIDMSRARTRSLIAALRKPFDAGAPPEREGDLGGFDLAAANALYAAWLAPLKDSLQGAHTVYISAGGPLSSLPWNVLTTAPAKSLADASWWVNQVTPVQMPSASSLVLARAQQAKPAKQPFVAFADPSFDGRDTPPAAPGETRAVRAAPLPAGAVPVAFDYRTVNRLPETLDEARAIGAALNAGDASVIRGTAATRSQVMKQDMSDVRVVEFATHGLLPGEVPGMLKAGLAMAYEGNGLADSVLTIDDIVGLRLDADWVVLSACNTGFANGYGGDSMSALSRGFFAAGSRTVLATQWAVESQSAKELTVGVFKASATDPALSKADALAATQREMIAGKYGALYKHPYFWAPYFVAGDASR